jgi:hypothetical protein
MATTPTVTTTADAAATAAARRALAGAPKSRNTGPLTKGATTRKTAQSHTGKRWTSLDPAMRSPKDHIQAANKPRARSRRRDGEN